MSRSYDFADEHLAALGRQRIAWSATHMPVLASIRERFAKERPLDGVTIGACLHITTETANLLRTLKAGGARVVACASNPLSTQDDVAASLALDEGIDTYAIKGEDADTYYRHMDSVLDERPRMTMDDGCDLVSRLHQARSHQVADVLAGTEETTTGVIRLRAMEADRALRYPFVARTTPSRVDCPVP
jgi:adenosylhomocysteinase